MNTTKLKQLVEECKSVAVECLAAAKNSNKISHYPQITDSPQQALETIYKYVSKLSMVVVPSSGPSIKTVVNTVLNLTTGIMTWTAYFDDTEAQATKMVMTRNKVIEWVRSVAQKQYKAFTPTASKPINRLPVSKGRK